MTLVADLNPAVSVPFSRMRQLLEDTALQAGVVGATDLKVAQRGAGANMSVDIAAGQAWVEVTTGTRNGLAHTVSDAVENRVVTASNATLPRIDQVVLQYNDSSIPTGSGDVPTLSVLAGTATSGATLDNRTGAAALGNDRLRLADILVPAASTSVVTANIRDRRPWARGAYNRIIRTSANYTTAAAGFALVDATNLQPRIECSGVPLRVSLVGQFSHSVASGISNVFPAIDGSLMDGAAAAAAQLYAAPGVNGNTHLDISWVTVPAAGSHLIGPMFAIVTAGTLTLYSTATIPLIFTVEEVAKPNASNT